MNKKSFIKASEINDILEKNKQPVRQRIRDILIKADEAKGLSVHEASALLHVKDKELTEEIFASAKKIKEKIYGNRIVIFVPLYLTNECNNICEYCAFRADNKEIQRKTLNLNEIKTEVEIIQKQGHKRILAVYGESNRFDVHKMVESIEVIYATKTQPSGETRRVNVNAAPLSVDDFKILKSSQIGTYQCFQETYHEEAYQKVHLAGPKTDFLWRLFALHRAQEAGIDDVAIGVLYGLFDPYFETLAMLKHAEELEKTFGVGPHTISFPRIEPALGSAMSCNPPYMVNDDLFRKIVAVTRLTVPYTGIILSTRESAELRHDLINLGVSQISAGSKTSPGSYHESTINLPSSQQFTIGDERVLDEVINDLVQMDLIPSFCTSCYRLGRHGETFMEQAKNLHIKSFCQPNAILTFAEYLEDYASDKTKKAGYEFLARMVSKLQNPELINQNLNEIKKGKRDIYY